MSEETSISETSGDVAESANEFCNDNGKILNYNISYTNDEMHTENSLQHVDEIASSDNFAISTALKHDEEDQNDETNVKKTSKSKHTVEAEGLTVSLMESGCESSVHSNFTEEPHDKKESAEIAMKENNEYKSNNNDKNDSQSDVDITLTEQTNSSPIAAKQQPKSKKKNKERTDAENSQSCTSDATSEEVESTKEKKKKKEKRRKVVKSEEENIEPEGFVMNNLGNSETIAMKIEDNTKTNAVQDENSSKQPLLYFNSNNAQTIDIAQETTTNSNLEEYNEAKLTSVDNNTLHETNANCLQKPREIKIPDTATDSRVKLETVETNLEHSDLPIGDENQVVAISLQSGFNAQYVINKEVNKSSEQDNGVGLAYEEAEESNIKFKPEYEDENTKRKDDLNLSNDQPQQGQKQEGDVMTDTNEESAYMQLKKMFLDNQESGKEIETSVAFNSHQPTKLDILPVPHIDELSQKEEHDVQVSHVTGREENATAVEEKNDLTRQCKKARSLVEQQHMLYSYLQDISRNFRSMELDAIVMKRDIIVHKYGVLKSSRHQIVSRASSKTNRLTFN